MKYICFLAIIYLAPYYCLAQSTFQKFMTYSLSDAPHSVSLCNDGKYLISGSTYNTSEYTFLTKIDIAGDTIWTRLYTGNLSSSAINSEQLANGDFFIAGTGGTTPSSYFLAKTDSNGNVLWSYTYGSSTEDNCWAGIHTNDNGFILTGRNNLSSTNTSILIVKTDSLGIVEWSRIINSTISDDMYCIRQTNDSGYILTGNTHAPLNTALIKLDSTGNFEWHRNYYFSGFSYAKSVLCTIDNGYLISGYTLDSNYDIFLIKTDSTGQVIWSKTYNSGGGDYGYEIIETIDGGFAVSGFTDLVIGGSTLLIRTDSSGNVLWSTVYTLGVGFYYNNTPVLIQTPDNGFIVAARSQFITGSGFSETYIIKTDSVGNSGCYSSNISMTVLPVTPGSNTVSPAVTMPNIAATPFVLTKDAGATVTTYCQITSSENEYFPIKQFSVYPNPVNGKISIHGIQNETGELVIYDFLGKRIMPLFQGKFSHEMEFDVSRLRSGIYFLCLTGDHGPSFARFIKE